MIGPVTNAWSVRSAAAAEQTRFGKANGTVTPSSGACLHRYERASRPSVTTNAQRLQRPASISSPWCAVRIEVVSAAAFPAPVLASQAVFRAVMDVFARPGTVKPLPPAVGTPPPLSATAAAVALAMLDYETPVWLDPPLAQSPQVADWIRLQAGAPVTSDPGRASFAFIADPLHAPAFDTFSLGTPEYPDRSATLVLQVEGFGTGQRLPLSGPGIPGVRSFSAQPLPPDFPARIAANRALFPRGIDVVLVSANSVAALPRSVALQRG
jgi:alpha-D-ribose 1-methylphosphonate 5-triphosphate synthase subunit PhnH